MKQLFYSFPILVFCTLLFGIAVFAQTTTKVNQKSFDEIRAFRQELSEAIKKGDRKTLENLFTDDFTHTHAVGKIDGKIARIDSILEGGKTLETIEPNEIKIRFYGKNTAIAVGQTTIDETAYSWTIVYIKAKKVWQIAASQASKIA